MREDTTRPFRNGNGIEVFDLSAIPQGGTLSTYAKLARFAEEDAVYLITNDHKHWITSAEAMDGYNFDPSKIVYLPRPPRMTPPATTSEP